MFLVDIDVAVPGTFRLGGLSLMLVAIALAVVLVLD